MSKATTTGEASSAILRRELRVPQQAAIEVDDDTYAYLLSRTQTLGESASDILRRELKLSADHSDDPTNPDPTGTIEFHIPAGIGAQAWNTQEHIIIALVGQTLRLVNDDSVPHKLHTSGAPFPHQVADILPGQSVDLLLQSPFDPGANHPLYDHNAGPSAQFWIKVRAAQ